VSAMLSLNSGPSMIVYISADPNLIPDGFKVASLPYLVPIRKGRYQRSIRTSVHEFALLRC
jgi:hypothetical protein